MIKLILASMKLSLSFLLSLEMVISSLDISSIFKSNKKYKRFAHDCKSTHKLFYDSFSNFMRYLLKKNFN